MLASFPTGSDRLPESADSRFAKAAGAAAF